MVGEIGFVEIEGTNQFSDVPEDVGMVWGSFHEAIWSGGLASCTALKAACVSFPMKPCGQTELVKRAVAPLEVSGKGQVGVDISWGSGKTEVTLEADVRIEDDRGNFVEGHAEQKSNGDGRAQVSAGHEEKK